MNPSSAIPRYLVPFDPKHLTHQFTDVLVIGGGLAGLRAVLEIDPSLSGILVTKDSLSQSNSSYAQGGIASVSNPEDRFEFHVQDTLAAGGELCDRKTVEEVIHQAPHRIQELIDWGTRFDQDRGALKLGREGGHSHHRIIHAMGDSTGREIIRAMIETVRKLEHIDVLEQTFTIDLLGDGERCFGALIAPRQGPKRLVWAKQTILCAGGAGQLYRESTNPSVATGDGQAMAFRAGAELRDMEFMQFHPTVLYIAGSGRSLITEAIRGEGAYLLDSDGIRFMDQYDERGELAPRDVVSQAIVAQMQATQHPCVYLDLSHLNAEYVRSRFPGIRATCAEFGLDIATDKIPVRPGAHYMIGGLTVDPQGQTSLQGLWAAGEVTSSGLHGANRLASNSLLEGLVYGANAGLHASNAALEQPDNFQALPLVNKIQTPKHAELDLADIRNSLKSLMWRCVGVRRSEATLAEASEMVEGWQRYVLTQQFDSSHGWELQNMLTIASVMIEAAQIRQESRGVHFRTDYPAPNNQQWLKHVCFCQSRHYFSAV
jgi:L-aspartate oxidase